MKARIQTQTKNMKDSLSAFKGKAGVDTTREVEQAFRNWLFFSRISEEQFLKNCDNLSHHTTMHFKIKKSVVNMIEVCEIGFQTAGDSKFLRIGEPIISNGEPNEREMWNINVSLLLFLMASKLDMAFKQSENYKKGDEDDYFYKCVKNQWQIKAVN